jgi:hypothetical protein
VIYTFAQWLAYWNDPDQHDSVWDWKFAFGDAR